MEKPTKNTEFHVFLTLAFVCISLLFWFHQPLALYLLPFLSLIFLAAAVVYNHIHYRDFRTFLRTLVHRNSLNVHQAIKMLEAYQEENPYWGLVSKKVYEDLRKMEFIREFCPAIAKNERINSAYRGRFIQQGHGNAIRELWKRQEMVISKPNDEGTVEYFLDALEACLACIETTVVGRTMAPEEYKAVEAVISTLNNKYTLKKALSEWPKIRTQEEKASWDPHWDGLWSYFREKYMEAVPQTVA